MTTAHWLAGVAWLFVAVLAYGLKATGENAETCLKGWDDCLRLLNEAHTSRRADREAHLVQLRRREWACLALLARQHRDGKHDSEDFRTCARCREVAAEVGAGKA